MVMGAFNRLLMSSSRSRGLITTSPLPFRRLGLFTTTTTTTTTTTVCRSSPWLMLPSSTVADIYTSDIEIRSLDYSFYRLSDKQVISLRNKGNSSLQKIIPNAFCFGSSNGWLLYCDPRDFSLYLVNPLCPTPPLVSIPDVFLAPANDHHQSIIDKFSIYGSPENFMRDFIIMIIIHNKKLGQKQLKFCCPSNTIKWKTLDHNSSLIDIIYSSKEQLFYTLDLNCEIQTWDLNGDDTNEIIIPKRKAYQPTLIMDDDDECLCTKYLVESNGDFLLVLRFCSKNYIENCNIMGSKTRRFDVYKLNEAKDSWEQLKSIGDRVLFLGMNESFSLSASDFPELKPNSIYYTGPAANEGKYSASDWGIYDLNEHTVTCHYPCDYRLKIRPPPIWIGPENSPASSTWRL